jgi:replicative DNA helicase
MTADLFHIESEQSVLGGLLIDPRSFEQIDDLEETDFYREDHRVIYRHIARLIADGRPVDVVTVAESLSEAGIGNESIGLAYLGDLAINTPSAANIRRYAEVVRDKRKRRDLLYASSQVADLAKSSGRSARELIDEAQALVFKLGDGLSSHDEPECVGALLDGVIGDIQARFENGGRIVGLPTGFAYLDEKTCGLSGGDLVIVAGRPSMGKTAFALNIAERVALNGKPVLVFSMEMSKRQLVERSLSSIGRIPLSAIRSGNLSEEHFGRLSMAMGKLFNSPLIVDDRPALRIAQMRSRTRRIARRHGLSLIVIDYIQLATGEGNNREQEVSSVSRGLKALAKEFDVPVIAISQLSRKVDERANNRPVLSDLRESGAIEQDADIVMMMYRDEYYHWDTPDKGIAEVIIGKHRQGETGMIPLVFFGEFTRFESMTQEARYEMFARHDEMERPKRRKKGFE